LARHVNEQGRSGWNAHGGRKRQRPIAAADGAMLIRHAGERGGG